MIPDATDMFAWEKKHSKRHPSAEEKFDKNITSLYLLSFDSHLVPLLENVEVPQ